jgi:hypothetical protein
MAPEAITVNGTNVLTLATMVTDGGPFVTAAGPRGEGIVVPGRDGRLALPRRWYDEASFVLPMWIKGIDPTTGLVPGGSDAMNEYYKRADFISQIFSPDAEPFTIDHTWTNGTVRRCQARLAAEPLDFTREKSTPLAGFFGVALTIPDATWADTFSTSQAISVTTGSTQTWSNFIGMTARIPDLLITFGPAVNPKIAQGNVSLAIAGNITSGRTAAFDAAAMTFVGNIDAGGTWTLPYTAITHLGDPRWFVLAPHSTPGQAPQTVLTHTGGGSAQVTLSGRKRYRVG